MSITSNGQTENYRGKVTDGLTIIHTDTHVTLYSRIGLQLSNCSLFHRCYCFHKMMKLPVAHQARFTRYLADRQTDSESQSPGFPMRENHRGHFQQ